MKDISEKIGLKIRERRKYLGLSLENLSHFLNCSVQTVAKYEKASIRIPTPVLYKIAKSLKTDVNFFFSDEFEPEEKKDVDLVREAQDLRDLPINVLFVEDNFADELLIRAAVEHIPHNVFILRDIEQFRSYLNRSLPNAPFSLPDLIILDLRLKNASGMELLSLLKKHPEMKSTPVVIYSNQCDILTLKACYQKGACGFIPKSFGKAEAVENLKKVMEYWSRCVVLPRVPIG